jgi:hypothetical protein
MKRQIAAGENVDTLTRDLLELALEAANEPMPDSNRYIVEQLPEILSLGMAGDPAAARQRLLDAVHDLRRLCRCRPVHPPDADDWLADDRAVRLAVPQSVADVQTRCRERALRCTELAGRASDPHLKAVLQHLAERWLKSAAGLEGSQVSQDGQEPNKPGR